MDNAEQVRVPAKLLAHPIHLFSLGFGSGLSPIMPGTTGTLCGGLLYWFLPVPDWPLYLAILVVSFLCGNWICDVTAKALHVPDHPAIVWDEIVGYWITMFMVPKTWYWSLSGFLLFRLFDIWKPWPVSLADKRVHGGFGIMLDDLVAALFSLIIIQITLYLL